MDIKHEPVNIFELCCCSKKHYEWNLKLWPRSNQTSGLEATQNITCVHLHFTGQDNSDLLWLVWFLTSLCRTCVSQPPRWQHETISLYLLTSQEPLPKDSPSVTTDTCQTTLNATCCAIHGVWNPSGGCGYRWAGSLCIEHGGVGRLSTKRFPIRSSLSSTMRADERILPEYCPHTQTPTTTSPAQRTNPLSPAAPRKRPTFKPASSQELSVN